MNDVLAMILAGGQGVRLSILSEQRAKPAVVNRRRGLRMAPPRPGIRIAGCLHLGGAPFAHAFGDDFD